MPRWPIWMGASAGGVLGSMIPLLWHAGAFSFSAMVLGTVGGLVGIWAGFKVARNL